MEETQCESCAAKGLNFKKRSYQLNFQEAILLCENKQCSDLFHTPDVTKLILPVEPAAKRPKPSEKRLRKKNVKLAKGCGQSLLNRSQDSTVVVTNSEGGISSENLQDLLVSVEYDARKHLPATTTTMNSTTTTLQNEPSATVVNMCMSSDGGAEGGSEVLQQMVSMPTLAILRPDGTIDTTALLNSNHRIVMVNDCAYLIEGGQELIMQDGTTAYELQDGAVSTHYPQWTNKDALCWLDVTLNLLVHNNTLKRFVDRLSSDSTVGKLMGLYNEATISYNEKFTSSMNVPRMQECENQVSMVMEKIRDAAFNHLHQKLKCNRGDEESPVFALPFLLKEENLMQHFSNHFQQIIKCDRCHFQQTRSIQKMVLTIDRVPSNFSMPNCQFVANCFVCGASDQLHEMKFDRLQPCVMIHFVNGLPAHDLSQYDFQFNQTTYAVTAVIQYKRNPNHFIAWIRNATDNTWMECDDLKPGPTIFQQHVLPKLLTHECHVVVWEQVDKNPVVEENVAVEENVELAAKPTSAAVDVDNHLADHMYSARVPNPGQMPQQEVLLSIPEDPAIIANENNQCCIMPAESFSGLLLPRVNTVAMDGCGDKRDAESICENAIVDNSGTSSSSNNTGAPQPLAYSNAKLVVKNVNLRASSSAEDGSANAEVCQLNGINSGSTDSVQMITNEEASNHASVQTQRSSTSTENCTVSSTSDVGAIQIGSSISVRQNTPAIKAKSVTPSEVGTKMDSNRGSTSVIDTVAFSRVKELLSGSNAQCFLVVVPDKSQTVESSINIVVPKSDAMNVLRTFPQSEVKVVVLPNAATASNELITVNVGTPNKSALAPTTCLAPKVMTAVIPAILNRNASVRETSTTELKATQVNGVAVTSNGPVASGHTTRRRGRSPRNGALSQRKPEIVVRAVEPNAVFEAAVTPPAAKRGRGRGRPRRVMVPEEANDAVADALAAGDSNVPENNLTMLSDVCKTLTCVKRQGDGAATPLTSKKKTKTFDSYPIRSKRN